MRRGKNFPMNAGTLIATAAPRHAAKQLQTHLGCSPRQAWRIVTTGRVPAYLRDRTIEFLEDAFRRNREAIERAEAQLKALKYAETMAGADPSHQARARTAHQVRVGQAEGAGETLALEFSPSNARGERV